MSRYHEDSTASTYSPVLSKGSAKMHFIFFCVLTSLFALTHGARFLSPLPDGTVVYACAGSSVTLSWQYELNQGDHINHVRWYYEGSSNTLIAYYSHGSFLPLPVFAQRVEFVANGGLQLRNLTTSDSGRYFVEISGVDGNGQLFQHMRHVLLEVDDGGLQVTLSEDAVLDNVTGQWSLVLSCGRFTYIGQPASPVEWVTPSGRVVWSSKYESGNFKLHLTTSSVEGGRYVCRVPTAYTSSSCLSDSQAARNVSVTVDKVDAKQTIANAELRSLTQRVVAGETEVRSLRANLSSLWATHRADNATLSRMFNNNAADADRAEACRNYTLWNDHTRSVTYGNVNNKCDSGTAFGWYRFQINGSNAVVPSTCGGPTWNNICDTRAPMWLDLQGAALPAVGQEIPALACASWDYNCCKWSNSDKWTPLVHNCGAFYVFKLQGFGNCDLRWCAQPGTN